jgi:hypothetical protein
MAALILPSLHDPSERRSASQTSPNWRIGSINANDLEKSEGRKKILKNLNRTGGEGVWSLIIKRRGNGARKKKPRAVPQKDYDPVTCRQRLYSAAVNSVPVRI